MGDRLRKARERQNWTQAMLAERAGVSRVQIARIEAGIAGKRPMPATVESLAQALGVRVAWLRTGERPMLSDADKE